MKTPLKVATAACLLVSSSGVHGGRGGEMHSRDHARPWPFKGSVLARRGRGAVPAHRRWRFEASEVRDTPDNRRTERPPPCDRTPARALR